MTLTLNDDKLPTEKKTIIDSVAETILPASSAEPTKTSKTNTGTYTYDDQQRLKTLVRSSKANDTEAKIERTFSYNDEGRISKIEHKDGNVATFEYGEGTVKGYPLAIPSSFSAEGLPNSFRAEGLDMFDLEGHAFIKGNEKPAL